MKWEYELKFPEQAIEIVDRAHAIATSTPRGPVYLSLPREVLCEPCPANDLDGPSRIAPATSAPRPADIETAADLLRTAKHPLIISQRGAGNEEGFKALSKLALDWGIPVCQYWAIQLGVPTDHPMAVGVDPAKWLAEADVVLVIDCLAPWSPDIHTLADNCKVVHIGQDPLYSRFPVRNFPCHLALAGDTSEVILSLAKAAEPHLAETADNRDGRRADIAAAAAKRRAEALRQAEAGNGERMTKAFVSLCLSKAIEGKNAAVLSELGAPLEPMTLREHGSWYQEPHSGGLGWSFPTGLGMKLANPDKLIIATMGDGSYMFSNPVVLPPDCRGARYSPCSCLCSTMPNGAPCDSLCSASIRTAMRRNRTTCRSSPSAPSPDFTKVAAASRAWTAKVERGDELPAALEAAIEHVTVNRTQALVEIRIA